VGRQGLEAGSQPRRPRFSGRKRRRHVATPSSSDGSTEAKSAIRRRGKRFKSDSADRGDAAPRELLTLAQGVAALASWDDLEHVLDRLERAS
jgi:hypothetical protein